MSWSLSEGPRAAARWSAVMLRLAYLSVTNAFALLRLLRMSDRDKDAEILALRHQITVLERQLGMTRPRVLPCRPGVPGRPAAPAPARCAWPVPAADPAGHGAALTDGPCLTELRGRGSCCCWQSAVT
jgi:hypothetical protein